MLKVAIDGVVQEAQPDELLIDLINRTGGSLPQWDGGSTIGESSCVLCGHCVTVCPCNALMEKTMLGHAGFLTSLKKSALSGMIDVVKSVEPETGYRAILQVSEAESAMRSHRVH